VRKVLIAAILSTLLLSCSKTEIGNSVTDDATVVARSFQPERVEFVTIFNYTPCGKSFVLTPMVIPNTIPAKWSVTITCQNAGPWNLDDERLFKSTGNPCCVSVAYSPIFKVRGDKRTLSCNNLTSVRVGGEEVWKEQS